MRTYWPYTINEQENNYRKVKKRKKKIIKMFKIKKLNITKAIRNTVGGVALFPNSYVMDVPQPNFNREIDFIFLFVQGDCNKKM